MSNNSTPHTVVLDSNTFFLALDAFVAVAQDQINQYYARAYKNLTPPTLSYEDAPKYIRIVRGGDGQRSVHCFIRKTDGAILKGSWKAPEPKKIIRGNIFNADHGLSGVTPHGAVYVR